MDIREMRAQLGITQAVSRYYYSNDNSFDGIAVSPEYQDRFEKLANEALAYYDRGQLQLLLVLIDQFDS